MEILTNLMLFSFLQNSKIHKGNHFKHLKKLSELIKIMKNFTSQLAGIFLERKATIAKKFKIFFLITQPHLETESTLHGLT